MVTGRCPCGCATINIAVDPDRAFPAMDLCSPVTETKTRAPFDADRFCELILFIRDGWLSSLELVWYGSGPVSDFPPSDDFDEPRVRC